MSRSALWHILLWGVTLFLGESLAAPDRLPATPKLPAQYQQWLDEEVVYIITDEERAEFTTLESDEERNQFIEDFWRSRNPNTTPEWNPFKEEHYRRLAYVNEEFAASGPGWKTDRGRIYIIYGPPDEREQHPANANPNPTPETSPLRRYATDTWIYRFLPGVGRNLFFIFVDECGCGQYQLIHDPTKKRPPKIERQKTISAKKTLWELVDRPPNVH